jgi:aldehyde:ferredoxin oxidoreductase
MDSQALKAKHNVLKEWSYDWKALEKGYTDKVLYVNVGSNEIKAKDVQLEVKEKFI